VTSDPQAREADLVAGLEASLEAGSAHVRELERQLAEVVAASRDSNADDEHDPEGATIAFERQQVVALLTAARTAREDLLRAIERVRDGTYGRCDRCGGPVGAARLQARPTARTCIACAGRR
jgi:RNA polymerase-binding transcription factor DksA